MKKDKHAKKKAEPATATPVKPVNPDKNKALYLYFPYAITALYFLLAFTGILHHEMWRDEYQAWMVARDAHSLAELFQNLKYEGNPVLWHFGLYIITSFTHDAFAMQVFHILIATGFIFIFNKYSPFPLLHKALFTFSYFAFFEYALISRSYGLGTLLLFGVCALYKNRHNNYLLIALLLFLMANTTVYAMLLSFCIALILFIDFFTGQKNEQRAMGKFVAAGGIVITGWALAAWQIDPEKDNTFPAHLLETFFDGPRFSYAFSRIATSYLSLPRLGELSFWNTNMFAGKTDLLNPLLPLLLLALAAFSLLHKPKALLLYLVGTIGLVLFIYYTFLAWHRYTGHLFIWLAACFWLAHYAEELNEQHALSGLAKTGKRIGNTLLLVIFGTSAAGGIGSWIKDFQKPFSSAKEAADFIHESKLDSLPIIGATDFAVSPLAGILDKKIYYPERKEFGSFTIWDTKRNDKLSFPDIIHSVDTVLQITNSKKLLMVLQNPPLTKENNTTKVLEHGQLTAELKIDLIRKVKNGIVTDEKYFIYMIEKTE